MSEKYVVLSLKEMAMFCDQQTREYVVQLQDFLIRRRREVKQQAHATKVAQAQAAARSTGGTPEQIPPVNLTEPIYFVLKLSDPFAIHALEHYILRASEAPEYGNANYGVRAAVDHALELKNRAMMFCDRKIPDPD